ncbi:MAG: TlyA family RNA methyltransferase [Spirochaetia bacterium]|nr:TlyA family RNA methyltransferase [Spirochaetia bacterium]
MRLDDWLVENGHAADKKKAEALILSGSVLVNDLVITHCGFQIKKNFNIRLKKQRKYVSRSAEKLKTVLEKWNFQTKNKTFIDIGASTGGFTDVLLNKGAAKVIALDVAYGFLHPKLRNDKRVTVIERKNIRQVKKEDLPFMPDYFTVDVSFISIQKVIHSLKKLQSVWQGIVLLKPQFEADKNALSKGIVKDKTEREKIVNDFLDFLKNEKIVCLNFDESAVKGTKGNIEYLVHIKWKS